HDRAAELRVLVQLGVVAAFDLAVLLLEQLASDLAIGLRVAGMEGTAEQERALEQRDERALHGAFSSTWVFCPVFGSISSVFCTWSGCVIKNSTRRFFSLPSALSLLAIGLLSP